MKINPSLLVNIIACFTALPAIAARDVSSDRMKRDERIAIQERFARADLDRSGGLSRPELKKTPKQAFPNLKKNFRSIDADRNGEVSLKERDAWIRRQAKSRR